MSLPDMTRPGQCRVGVQGAGVYQTVVMRGRVRLLQHGTVLSEIRSTAGPTHSVADAIAGLAHSLKPGGRLAMLGFAGGGIVAPLFAMGHPRLLWAVDLDDSGWRLFRSICPGWARAVRFHRGEACAWLRARRARYDAIIEDLSVPGKGDVQKPEVTWGDLPRLIHHRLNPGGVAVFNLLRPTDGSWAHGLSRVLTPGWAGRLVHFRDFENRLLAVGRRLPDARLLSRRLRDCLGGVGSRLASRVAVRAWEQ